MVRLPSSSQLNVPATPPPAATAAPAQTPEAPTPIPAEEEEPAGNSDLETLDVPNLPDSDHVINLVPVSWLDKGVWISSEDKAVGLAGAPNPETWEEFLELKGSRPLAYAKPPAWGGPNSWNSPLPGGRGLGGGGVR